MRFKFSLLFGAILLLVALPKQAQGRSLAKRRTVAGSGISSGCSTNAECFKRGLPPLPQPNRTSRKRQGAATISQALPPPKSYLIEVTNVEANNQLLGYLSLQPGFYGYLVSSFRSLAAIIQDPGVGPSERTNLIGTARPAYPYICAVSQQGPNLTPGSTNSALITACDSATSPGSPPGLGLVQFNSPQLRETAIFRTNLPGYLRARWVNADNEPASPPDNVFLAYFSSLNNADGSFIYLSADATVFQNAYSSNYKIVNLRLVPV